MKLSFPDSGKLLRMGNGCESIPAVGWIATSCTFDSAVITVEQGLANLREGYANLLSNFFQLRLTFKKVGEGLQWQLAHNEDLAFENIVTVVAPPDDDVPEFITLERYPLWRFRLCEIKDEKGAATKTHARVLVSHAIADGRSTTEIFELLLSVMMKRPFPERFAKVAGMPAVLHDFTAKSWFTEEITKDMKYPESWDKLTKHKLFPKVELPSHVVNLQWDYDYAPVSAFCHKYGVTVQGILSASQSLALWEYHRGELDSVPLAVYITVDCRRSKYATKAMKEGAFFSRAGIIFAFVEKQKTLLEHILHCSEQVKKAVVSYEASKSYYLQANFVDEKTGIAHFPQNFPDFSTQNIFCASHLGLICPDLDEVRFNSISPVIEWGYWPNIYAFHTKKVLSFMFTPPYNVDERFVTTVHDMIDKTYSFIKADVLQ